MKHIKTFEGYVADLNEAASSSINALKKAIPGIKFEEQEIEFDPEEGYKSVESFTTSVPGLDDDLYINVYDGESFCFFYDAAPIATSLHSKSEANSMMQTQTEVPVSLSKLNKGLFDEVVKTVKDQNGIEEANNFMNEDGPAEGPKVKKFFQLAGENTVSETIKDMEGQEEPPSDALYNAMKQSGCKKAEECIVVGEYHTDNWNDVLTAAKKAGLKYVEASDENGAAIVFDAKQ